MSWPAAVPTTRVAVALHHVHEGSLAVAQAFA